MVYNSLTQTTWCKSFIFKFGQTEYICQASSRYDAFCKANQFIDFECPMDEPFGWVSSDEGPNIFRMSVGA